MVQSITFRIGPCVVPTRFTKFKFNQISNDEMLNKRFCCRCSRCLPISHSTQLLEMAVKLPWSVNRHNRAAKRYTATFQ